MYGEQSKEMSLYTYDKRNRFTEAGHTLYDMSTDPICYSETMSYNRNSAVTSLTRTSNGQGYGNIDQLTYTYTGNRLKAIIDAASPNVYNGGFEFVNKVNLTQEYWYNTAGEPFINKNNSRYEQNNKYVYSSNNGAVVSGITNCSDEGAASDDSGG